MSKYHILQNNAYLLLLICVLHYNCHEIINIFHISNCSSCGYVCCFFLQFAQCQDYTVRKLYDEFKDYLLTHVYIISTTASNIIFYTNSRYYYKKRK